jgi:hypothetical protein
MALSAEHAGSHGLCGLRRESWRSLGPEEPEHDDSRTEVRPDTNTPNGFGITRSIRATRHSSLRLPWRFL